MRRPLGALTLSLINAQVCGLLHAYSKRSVASLWLLFDLLTTLPLHLLGGLERRWGDLLLCLKGGKLGRIYRCARQSERRDGL